MDGSFGVSLCFVWLFKEMYEPRCWCQEIPLESGLRFAQIKGLSDWAFQCRGCKFASNSGNLHKLQICLQGSGETSSFFIWRDILACFVKGKKNTNS
uniref:Uncharacterized protein n=1 Tax=Oryza meridionalis TaxID=40149 RepID=A0A0E0CHL2_9ORYZ